MFLTYVRTCAARTEPFFKAIRAYVYEHPAYPYTHGLPVHSRLTRTLTAYPYTMLILLNIKMSLLNMLLNINMVYGEAVSVRVSRECTGRP